MTHVVFPILNVFYYVRVDQTRKPEVLIIIDLAYISVFTSFVYLIVHCEVRSLIIKVNFIKHIDR